LILANETGGRAGAARLQSFVSAYPDAEILVFADAIAGIDALVEAWQAARELQPLAVLLDIGSGRTGTRTLDQAEALADAVQASGGRLRLAGIGAYEGNTIHPDADASAGALDELILRIADMFVRVRLRLGGEPEMILTVGGSLLFEQIVDRLASIVRGDGRARLVLRSGAVFFYDHGICQRFLHSPERRQRSHEEEAGPLNVRTFVPALRLWAEVLSRPEPGLAICGLGMRDASFDQGFPVVLHLHRGGRVLPDMTPMPAVTKLNDQHSFLEVSRDTDIAVGDIVEFGVTHACTTIDRHDVIYGLDAEGFVRHVFPTFFG
jgi:D-serine dehydratase